MIHIGKLTLQLIEDYISLQLHHIRKVICLHKEYHQPPPGLCDLPAMTLWSNEFTSEALRASEQFTFDLFTTKVSRSSVFELSSPVHSTEYGVFTA